MDRLIGDGLRDSSSRQTRSGRNRSAVVILFPVNSKACSEPILVKLLCFGAKLATGLGTAFSAEVLSALPFARRSFGSQPAEVQGDKVSKVKAMRYGSAWGFLSRCGG